MTASPILNAAYAGDVAVVSALLAQDRTLANARGEGEGATPLAMAACGGCLAVVQLLVDAGADINAVTNDGTALLMAAWFNHLDIVAWLLDHGADPNEASASGETPLHAAALKGFLNVGQVLIARGAAVNCRTTTGTTDFFSGSPPVCGESPLHLAGAYGHLEFIELLLQNGADKIITDHTGQTPLHWAARYRQDAAYQRLR